MSKKPWNAEKFRNARFVMALLCSLWVCRGGAWASQEPGGPKGAGGAPESEIVARVNGESVTRGELQRLLANPAERPRLLLENGAEDPDGRELERLALRKLIHRQLLIEEAGRRGILVSDRELDEAIAALRRRFGDLRSLGIWMKEQGLDDRALFETIRADIQAARVRASLVEGVRVSEHQQQQYYDSHKADLKTEEVRLQIIVVRDRTAAEDILKAVVERKEDFGRLARQRSIGLRAAQGGDTGWVESDSLGSPLREAVHTLKPREVLGPLPRGDEFLIVRLHERRSGRTRSLAEARRDIERLLLPASQREAVSAWLRERERKARIEVLLQGGPLSPSRTEDRWPAGHGLRGWQGAADDRSVVAGTTRRQTKGLPE